MDKKVDETLSLIKEKEITPEYLLECAKNWYNEMRENKNNFSYWYPKIKDCGMNVPKSWYRVLSFEEWNDFTHASENSICWIYDFVKKEIIPNITSFTTLFMKNGTFSDKYNFAVCTPHHTPEYIAMCLQELTCDSMCCDAGGDTEIVFRERIPSKGNALTIYNGMPLQTEFRVFYDFDRRKVAYIVNYWDWEYCSTHIKNNPTDGIIYSAAYPSITTDFYKHREEVSKMVSSAMENVELTGKWSIDVLYNGTDFYLIDMAEAHRSAYYDLNKFK